MPLHQEKKRAVNGGQKRHFIVEGIVNWDKKSDLFLGGFVLEDGSTKGGPKDRLTSDQVSSCDQDTLHCWWKRFWGLTLINGMHSKRLFCGPQSFS
ncbi:hypothetical protein L484_018928 [Morus notabilis]|uniref:Uncharacterized protein n=1 Tax=Morus notabilis TaxID=981085 RepID=W9QZ37_9ROSA|nr:hypothetical protein L484_018928 [Morus notabilis]